MVASISASRFLRLVLWANSRPFLRPHTIASKLLSIRGVAIGYYKPYVILISDKGPSTRLPRIFLS